jgi:hypothetical protein
MRGPDDGFRRMIGDEIDGLETADDPEAALDSLLARIQDAAASDEPAGLESEEAAYRELGAIEAWASLASDAVQALYESRSPNLLRRRGDKRAGWSTSAAERLRRIAGALRDKLGAVAAHLGGLGFGVGVAFPGGISIFISWTL